MLLMLLYATLAHDVVAQGFSVRVEMPVEARGKGSLYLYTTDAMPHAAKGSRNGNNYLFQGSVDGVVYAEFRYTNTLNNNAVSIIPFFVENSDIVVRYNMAAPEMSPIVGSRSNSEYRYQLEQQASNPTHLARYAASHPSSPITPYIIYRHMANDCQQDTLQQLAAQLTGEAQKVYHYGQLQRMLSSRERLRDGERLPTVVFRDRQGHLQRLDTLLADSCYHAVLVGASWCEQCQRAATALHSRYPEMQTIEIDIDSDKRCWDSPWLELLQIDHIPYLIVLDSQQRIVARDVRIWELERLGALQQSKALANK